MHYGRPIQRCASNMTTRKWQARTDVQTHSSISDSSEHFQITAPSLIPSGWCSWSEAQQQRPWGGLELCQQLGPFQHSHVLFMDIHQLSSLIRQTLRQTSAETHACTHTDTLTRGLIKDTRHSETRSAGTSESNLLQYDVRSGFVNAGVCAYLIQVMSSTVSGS